MSLKQKGIVISLVIFLVVSLYLDYFHINCVYLKGESDEATFIIKYFQRLKEKNQTIYISSRTSYGGKDPRNTLSITELPIVKGRRLLIFSQEELDLIRPSKYYVFTFWIRNKNRVEMTVQRYYYDARASDPSKGHSEEFWMYKRIILDYWYSYLFGSGESYPITN